MGCGAIGLFLLPLSKHVVPFFLLLSSVCLLHHDVLGGIGQCADLASGFLLCSYGHFQLFCETGHILHMALVFHHVRLFHVCNPLLPLGVLVLLLASQGTNSLFCTTSVVEKVLHVWDQGVALLLVLAPISFPIFALAFVAIFLIVERGSVVVWELSVPLSIVAFGPRSTPQTRGRRWYPFFLPCLILLATSPHSSVTSKGMVIVELPLSA